MSVSARERSAFGQFQLNRSGINIGVDYTKVRHVSTADMAAMLRDGATLAEVCEAFGRSKSSVVGRLVDAGWSSRDGQPMRRNATQCDAPDPEPTPDAPARVPQYQIAFVDQPWADQALCAQTDPEIFFPEKSCSTREAKAVCAHCFVQAECLDYALATGERFGVWGGLSERERRALAPDAGPISCPHCDRTFTTKAALSGHLGHHLITERTTPMTTIKILLIPANPAEPITWHQVDRGLASFQDLVGGDVQVVPLDVPGCDLWCNEDPGLRLYVNRRATTLYHQAGGLPWADVKGDTFITGGTDDIGETIGLTPEQAEQLHLPEQVAS